MAKERKGKKLRRCAKHSNKYKVQFGKTDANKKRRYRRHLKKYPEDKQGVVGYEKRYGN